MQDIKVPLSVESSQYPLGDMFWLCILWDPRWSVWGIEAQILISMSEAQASRTSWQWSGWFGASDQSEPQSFTRLFPDFWSAALLPAALLLRLRAAVNVLIGTFLCCIEPRHLVKAWNLQKLLFLSLPCTWRAPFWATLQLPAMLAVTGCTMVWLKETAVK